MKSLTSGTIAVHSGASEAPSKVTEPIMTASSGTVPGPVVKFERPDSGRRRPISSPLRASGEMRLKRLK